MRVAVLTPLSIEYDAVCAFLTKKEEVQHQGSYYTKGQYQGQHHCFELIVRETGSRNSVVAIETERIISGFQPTFVFLNGIAGGVKDAELGDIVVGTHAYGYGAGKATTEGFSSRPFVQPQQSALLEMARVIARSDKWKVQSKNEIEPRPKVHFGPIASDNQVVATRKSEAYQIIKQHYNDTLALEMEAIGFAEALARHKEVLGLNIRAISDLLDGKNGAHDRIEQPKAAANAATFLFYLIDHLEPEKMSGKSSTPRKLAQRITEELFPLLPPTAPYVPKSENPVIGALWQLVETIFTEELAEEETLAEAEVTIRSGLRKQIKTKPEWGEQLEELLAQLGEETPAQQPTYQQNINNDNARIGQQINIQEWTSGELIFNNKKKKRRKP